MTKNEYHKFGIIRQGELLKWFYYQLARNVNIYPNDQKLRKRIANSNRKWCRSKHVDGNIVVGIASRLKIRFATNYLMTLAFLLRLLYIMTHVMILRTVRNFLNPICFRIEDEEIKACFTLLLFSGKFRHSNISISAEFSSLVPFDFFKHRRCYLKANITNVMY